MRRKSRLDLCDGRPALDGRGDRRGAPRGSVVVGSAVDLAPGAALAHAAPLFEEEGDVRASALVADRLDPAILKRPGARATLAAEDHPADAPQVDGAEVLKERLHREHPEARRRVLEVLDPR